MSDTQLSWEIQEGVVRPYFTTSGRTRPQHHGLRVETMIEATPAGIASAAELHPEPRAIVHLCAAPHPVAAVAAKLRSPLGVIRVLVGDLADGGLIRPHSVDPLVDDIRLLERLIEGVRAT